MASGHVNRIYRPNTWLHRPMLQNVKKALANSEPSTHGTKRTCPALQRMSAIEADIPKRDLRHGYEDVDPFAAGHTARCGIGQSSLQSSLTVRGRPSKKYVMEDPCHRSSSPRAAAPLP